MSNRNHVRLLLLTIALIALLVAGFGPSLFQQGKQHYHWLVTKRLTVLNDAEFRGDITHSGDYTVENLTVEDDTTLGDAAGDTVAVTGDMTITGHRDGLTDYDYFIYITGNTNGQANNAKTYAVNVDVTRTLSNTHGNIVDSAIVGRISTTATEVTSGIVMQGVDGQAKVDDNAAGSVIRGGQFTADTDAGSSVDSATGIRAYVEGEGLITSTMQIADFELSRKQATDPTAENGVVIRNTSTAGGGADAAIVIESSYGAGGSADDDDWLYGIDMASADAATADIRLTNGETIVNTTDTAVQISGFLALEEGAVVDLGAGFTLTPAASYQPITNSTAGSITSDGTTSIANGVVAGQLLMVCNEDDQDIVFTDNTNIKMGGDITLAASTDSCMTLLWDGDDWVGLAVHAN